MVHPNPVIQHHVRAAPTLRRRAATGLAAAALLLAFLTGPVARAAGQGSGMAAGVEEPEVPTTLFSLQLGDASVDLSATGSWGASLSAGIGVLFTPDSSARLMDYFPGMEQGVAFSQVPDLTLSVSLMRRYFIDVSFLGGFQDNWLLMGYRGASGEPLQSIVAGNRDIGVASSPFVEIPVQSRGSLGVSAALVGPGASSELMLRWDATGLRHKRFLGLAELTEQRLGPESFTPGRYFFLPDAGASDLVIYLEDAEGTRAGDDGHTYRLAGYDDVTVDSANGLVSLKAARTGRVLAYYTKDAASVGDLTLGRSALPAVSGPVYDVRSARDFDFASMSSRKVLVDGRDCLLLWQPGDQSPFQIDSSYPLEGDLPGDTSRMQVLLEKRDPNASWPPQLEAELSSVGLAARVLPDEQRLVVYADTDFRAAGLAADGLRLLRFLNLYPFHTATPGDDINLLYGPDRADLAGSASFDILVQTLRPVERYVLEPGVVPGSVQVTVNGVEETGFDVDTDSGNLTFERRILPTDRVEVSYRTAGAGTAAGDAVLAWRGEIQLAEFVDLWMAAGIRWNLGSTTFSDRPYEHTGTIIAAAGIEGTSGPFAWSARVAGSFTDPDTTGVARLHGMEGHGIEASLNEETAWPSAPPTDPLGALAGLNRDNRGKLLYKDFREYDAFGGYSLHPIGWTGATSVDYATGGRPGPYNVLGSSAGDSDGASLVLDFELGANQWVGTQMPVVAGRMPDLSTAKSITIRFRPYAMTGSVQLYLELGGLSEDIDGDGILDAEVSPADSGFAFNDPANGAVLKVGAGPRLLGNGVRDTEDWNGNGILDLEDRSRIVQKTDGRLALSAASDTWTVVTVSLDDVDRGKLASTRGIRLVAVGTTDATGIIQVDTVTVDGSSYWLDAPGDPNATIREVPESLALSAPAVGARLGDVYPAQIDQFHPSGEIQEVLEADWSGATGDVTITGYSDAGHSTISGAGIPYDTAVAFVRAVGIDGAATLDFELADPCGKGIRWSLGAGSLAGGAWHEVRASRTQGTVLIDGTTNAGAPAFDDGYGQLSHLKVTVSGSSAGTLYLDEIHLRDPHAAWGAAGAAEVTWQAPGTVLSAGSVPLLANVRIAAKVAAATDGFSSLYGVPQSGASVLAKAAVGFDALWTRVDLEALAGVADGEPTAAGSHRIALPAQPSPFSFTDQFSLSASGEFSRENTLALRPFAGLSLDLESEATGATALLTQSWKASLDLGPVLGVMAGMDLDAGLSAIGYPLAQEWYGARWLREASLLVPWSGTGDIQRWERLGGVLSASVGPVVASAGVTAAAWSTDVTEVSRTQRDTLESDVQLRSAIGPADGHLGDLSLSYRRLLELVGERGSGDRFVAETEEFVGLMAGQRYFFTSIPFVEIFGGDGDQVRASWAGTGRGKWTPSVSLSWQRPPGSRLLDLLVPSVVELSACRDLEQSDALWQDEISLSQRVGWHAVNLFGRLGSIPIARFYRTDEFGLGVTSVESGAPAGGIGLDDLAVEAYASFVGDRGGSLTILNSFNVPADDSDRGLWNSLQANLGWSVHPASGIALPYLPADVARTGFWGHEEGLDLTIGEEVDGHPFTVILRHATSIQYPQHGSLKAEVKAGMDTERLAGGGLAGRFAVSGSLEASIKF